MLKPQKKGTIFLATFPGFLEAKLSKNLPSQTFHNKNFTFYALKHKNLKRNDQKKRSFFWPPSFFRSHTSCADSIDAPFR